MSMRFTGITRIVDVPSIRRFFAKTNDEGTALIETAVTLPLLFLMLLGAVEFARASYAAIEVSNAANAGAQYGSQSATLAADAAGIQLAAQNDAANLTLGTTNSSISCICSDGTASTCNVATDCTTSHMERILTVDTQYSYVPTIHLPGFLSSLTMRGHAVRKVIQ